jgi:hypothetical protein
LHAGFALGLALLLLFLAGEFLEQVASSRPSNHARLRALAITFVFDLLLVPLNPNVTRMYFYPVDTLRSKAMQNYIAEWASPNFHHAEYIPFLLLLLTTTAILAWSRFRVRPRDILLLMVSTFAALSSIRMIPFYVLVALPVLSRPVELWAASQRSQRRPRAASRVPLPYAGVLNALILFALLGFVGFQIKNVVQRQPEVEAQHFPVGAVAYLQAHAPSGPLFNLYDWGGYLIWRLNPQTPVFIDGRADLYGESLMRQFAEMYGLKGGWQESLQTWRIKTILVNPDSALAVALRNAPGWQVGYSDSLAIVLERFAPQSP